MNLEKIGNFLKSLRREKGLTQEQLAEILNVSGRTVSRWETGRNLPDLDLIVFLSDFYSVEIREIIDGERETESRDNEYLEEKQLMADYSTEKEKMTLKKIFLTVATGMISWIVSLGVMLRFFNDVTDSTMIIAFNAVGFLLYCLFILCGKANKTVNGYINSLAGAFISVIIGNSALMIVFFSTGRYHNYGLAGVWYAFVTVIAAFLTAAILVTVINKKNSGK